MNLTTLNIVGVPEHFNLAWRRLSARRALEGVGIALNWREIREGTGYMLELLGSGDADIALLLTEGAVTGIARQQSVEILGPWVTSPLRWGVHVAAASPIQSIDDVVGQRFAISRYGSGSHLMGALYARDWPGAPEYVVVDHLDGARRALAEGGAELFLWERFTTQPYVDRGEFRRVDEIPTPWPCFVAAIRSDLPETSRLAARAALAAATWEAAGIADDETAVNQFASEYELVPEQVEAWLSGTTWATAASLEPAVLEGVADTLRTIGILDTVPDSATWSDVSRR